ncbi:MAG TPA: hypothetical protein VHT96_16555 [Clostridia bacterium]|nr:hypothetical protein [Clostridia bacterium]
MTRSKFMKVFIVGLGLTTILSTGAFAEEMLVPPDKPVSSAVIASTARTAPDKSDAASGIARTGSGTAPAAVVSEPAGEPDQISKAMYVKQSEIDKYLFDEHKAEIAAKGITVTYTVASSDFVEIGIMPFNKENEEFIYQALGRDQVKVVEGAQAIAYSTGSANDSGGLMYATGVATGEAGSVGTPAEAQVVSAPMGAKEAAPSDAKADAQAPAPSDAHIYTAAAVKAPAQNGKPISTATLSAIAAVVLALLGGILYKTRRVRTAKR